MNREWKNSTNLAGSAKKKTEQSNINEFTQAGEIKFEEKKRHQYIYDTVGADRK